MTDPITIPACPSCGERDWKSYERTTEGEVYSRLTAKGWRIESGPRNVQVTEIIEIEFNCGACGSSVEDPTWTQLAELPGEY